MWIVFLVLLLVSLGRAEREYFLQPNASSWESARQHCQVCYREMATITTEDAHLLLEQMDNRSRAAWVGLRRLLNETVAPLSNTTNSTKSQRPESQWFSGTPPWVQFSNGTNDTDGTIDVNSTWFSFFEGKLPWSRWSNGDPVTIQNWYPGRPVPKPKPKPIKCELNTHFISTTSTPSYSTYSTADGISTVNGNSTADGNSTMDGNSTVDSNSTFGMTNQTSTCPQLEKLLKCIEDPEAKDALSRSLTTPSLYQTSWNATISPNSTMSDINTTVTTPNPNVTNSNTNNTTFTDSITNTTMSHINTTATTPNPNVTNSNTNNATFTGTITNSTLALSTSAATSTSAPSTISTSVAPASTIPPPTIAPCPDLTDSREEDLNKFIEDACLVLLSFGLWWERACSEVLPYICYDDRFYGKVMVHNITYVSAAVQWLKAPGEISGYRVEVKSQEHYWTQDVLTSALTTEFTNLTSGTKYMVYVFPIKCGRDLNPQTDYFYSQPDQIQNLSLSDIQETSVNLTWSPPPGGIDFYRLCVYDTSNFVNCTNVTISQHTVKYLIAGGEYTVEVSAEVADESIPGRRFNKSFFTRPNKVKNLQVKDPSTNTFKVVWEKPEGNANRYRVLVQNGSVLFNETTNSFTFTATGLVPGSEFDITVWAQVNESWEGKPVTIQGFTKPGPVRDLKMDTTANEITVTWTNPVGGHTNFSVLLLDPDGTDVEEQLTPNTTVKFSKLKAGAQYMVEVKVIGLGKLQSDITNKSDYTLPNEPKDLKMFPNGTTQINLTWKVPDDSDGVTIKYDVVCMTKFWGYDVKKQVEDTNTTLTDLRPGTTYGCNVSVFAGKRSSKPIYNEAKTVANKRNITLTMLCKSSEPLGCTMQNAQANLLKALKANFSSKLDGIFWDLNWKN
ncbi:tenascin-R [Alosa pseudoharengus]|uniref:tenascin-R n=1 Tax=Alosa pseudoharengus TaxID=34774 RepID=UPI003F89148F